jgi:lysyl-tRNA synthetase, class II
MVKAARNTGLVFVGFLVLLAASGWLYVVRPDTGGLRPSVPEALPLDELAHKAGVSVLGFFAVWGAAALLVGLLARAARLDRLTAAVVLMVGVGAFEFLAVGVSLAVVRQVSFHEAFASATDIRAVSLPALLAAMGGAIWGHVRSGSSSRAPLLLAWGVAAAGAIGLADALLPAHDRTFLGGLAPDAVRPVTSALVGPLSLALLVVARGLARRKRRTWQVALVLLGGSSVLHVLHGFNTGALVTTLLAVALVAYRHDFDAPGDPASRLRLVLRALLVAAGITLYGALALWLNRLALDQPASLGLVLRETGAAAVGGRLGGSARVEGVGEWFALSVFIAALAGGAWVLLGWIAPWRYRVRQEARERALARRLVAAWGEDTLAPFVLRADKSYFFSPRRRAFVAYRVVGGVAIVSGDPVGPRAEHEPLLEDFIAFARDRGWRLAILGASERRLALYRRLGLHALYHGDEAVVETEAFSLEGRSIRKVRQSVHRLSKAGYRAEVLRRGQIDARLRGELEAIANAWRGTEPERGFVMALDALFRLGDEDALFVVGRDGDGAPAGFLHFAVCRAAGGALSLSSMPRLRETPNGFNEWLICEAVEWARENGFPKMSLNFAPFAALLAPEAELSRIQRVERRALLRLKGRFQLDNLLVFNRKFFPSWERRFVVYERRLDLPRVGIAALAAEAYLPFSGRNGR